MLRLDKLTRMTVLMTSIILTIIFLFSRANNFLTENYFNAFFPITLGVTIMLVIISLMEENGHLNKPFFFNEPRPQTPFKDNVVLKLLTGLGLAIVFSVGAIGLGSAIIDIPQPFQQQAFTQVTEVDKLFFQSVIPGFYEEASIFILVSALTFLGVLFLRPRKLLNLLFIQFGASSVGALVLTQAHRYVYGSDQVAYLGIFLFEVLVQFFNQYTGMFISWIPHIIHNGVVSLNFLVAFSVGGFALGLHNFYIWQVNKHE